MALDVNLSILTVRLDEERNIADLTAMLPFFSLYATAIHTVPTGFSGVPPSGPAIPVVAKEKSLPVRFRTPVAIASAHSRLTAPWVSIIFAGTPNTPVFTELAYEVTEPRK